MTQTTCSPGFAAPGSGYTCGPSPCPYGLAGSRAMDLPRLRLPWPQRRGAPLRRTVQSALGAVVALTRLLGWLVPTGGPSYPRKPLSFATGVANGVYEKYG